MKLWDLGIPREVNAAPSLNAIPRNKQMHAFRLQNFRKMGGQLQVLGVLSQNLARGH
jgi:hypothetical protein